MSKKYDRLLDRATDATLVEPNWLAILECCDAVRAGEIGAPIAALAIRKRIQADNPHVAHHALLVLESAVKNCGEKFLLEIATKECMEELKHLAKEASAEKVKEKVLELIQCWATVFKTKDVFKIIVDTFQLMKLEGFDFPPLSARETERMFEAQSAPEWTDAAQCSRCRAAFGLITRKHHCRACGHIFCDKCSSRQLELPHLGIDREVRVCETCFDKLSKKEEKSSKADEVKSSETKESAGDSSAKSTDDSKKEQKQREQKEEEELALAMAISQSEAEERDRQRQLQLYNLYNGPDSGDDFPMQNGPPAAAEKNASANDTLIGYKGTNSTDADKRSSMKPQPAAETESELAKYLNRDYWENRRTEQKTTPAARQSPTPSAPPPSEAAMATTTGATGDAQQQQNGYNAVAVEPTDTDRFAAELKAQVETFVNRIRSDQARGRSIVNDSGIQSLFVKLTGNHADVLQRMQTLDDRRAYVESLQDRLAHIVEAREAVEALRHEHHRRLNEAAVEEQRRRQILMQQQLGVMRLKKHEMLETQRQMALQRFQQQEQEMQMRKMQMIAGVGPQAPVAPHYQMPQQQQQQQMQQYQPQQPPIGYQPGPAQYTQMPQGYPTQMPNQQAHYGFPPQQQPQQTHPNTVYNMQPVAQALPPAPQSQQQQQYAIPQQPAQQLQQPQQQQQPVVGAVAMTGYPPPPPQQQGHHDHHPAAHYQQPPPTYYPQQPQYPQPNPEPTPEPDTAMLIQF